MLIGVSCFLKTIARQCFRVVFIGIMIYLEVVTLWFVFPRIEKVLEFFDDHNLAYSMEYYV